MAPITIEGELKWLLDHVTILHMSRQLSCRDMCKIMTCLKHSNQTYIKMIFMRQGSHGVGKSGKGMEFNFDSSRPGNGLEFHVVVGKCG